MNLAFENSPPQKRPRPRGRGLAFQISPITQGLLGTMSTKRKSTACRDTFMRIGQYCVDSWQDGWITERQLRDLNKAASWRTMQGYIALLVDCGALERLDDYTYSVANFFDTNYCVARREEWLEHQRANNRERSARCRRRQKTSPDCEPNGELLTNGQKNNTEMPEKTELFEARDGQGTEEEKIVSYVTNPTKADETTSANNVPSKVNSEKIDPKPAEHRRPKAYSSVVEESHVDDAEHQARLAKFAALSSKPVPSEEKSPPIQQVTDRPSKPADKPKYKAARMPKDSILANFHSAESALKEACGDPDPHDVDFLWQALARISARDVEVGYAVHTIKAQKAKGRQIKYPAQYLLTIIAKQRAYRAADEGAAEERMAA